MSARPFTCFYGDDQDSEDSLVKKYTRGNKYANYQVEDSFFVAAVAGGFNLFNGIRLQYKQNKVTEICKRMY